MKFHTLISRKKGSGLIPCVLMCVFSFSYSYVSWGSKHHSIVYIFVKHSKEVKLIIIYASVEWDY